MNFQWTDAGTEAFIANYLANLAAPATIGLLGLLLSFRPTRRVKVSKPESATQFTNYELRLIVFLARHMRVVEVVSNDPHPPQFDRGFEMPKWLTGHVVRARSTLDSLCDRGICSKSNIQKLRQSGVAYSLTTIGEQKAIEADRWVYLLNAPLRIRVTIVAILTNDLLLTIAITALVLVLIAIVQKV